MLSGAKDGILELCAATQENLAIAAQLPKPVTGNGASKKSKSENKVHRVVVALWRLEPGLVPGRQFHQFNPTVQSPACVGCICGARGQHTQSCRAKAVCCDSRFYKRNHNSIRTLSRQ